ncbi:MAG TPA: hypothetical protein VMX35_10915 [Acidobacteriota bacterium]|nr:hypothetical protein [Acidobacteriota bacterium]
MNRQRARELLIDYLNGHLEGEQKEKLEELLSRDEKLRLEAEEIKREVGILRSAIHDPLEEARMHAVSNRVMSDLRSRREGSLRDLPLPWRSYLRAAAVVFFIVIAVALFFLLRPGELAEAPQSAEADEEHTAPAVVAPVEKPRAMQMSFATDDPKVRIYWTFSENFELDAEGE